jgi:hypothetical protein
MNADTDEMEPRVPIDAVRGEDEVTVWMWPNDPDPVTIRFTVRKWARIEQKAEREAGGDVERVIGEVLAEDIEGWGR